MEALLQDVRSGLRQLSAQRGSSAVAVATLALGIGASAAALALIDATILNPFAYVNSAEIVQIEVTVETPGGQVRDTFGSYDHMRAWQALDELFVSVASWRGTAGQISDANPAERLVVRDATEQYLTVHGAVPVLGRDLVRGDLDEGAPAVALLGYGYWQRRYGGRDVVGETLTLNDAPFVIVGVLPAWFEPDVEVVRPLLVDVRAAGAIGSAGNTRARLRAGVSAEQAGAQLTARLATTDLQGGVSPIAVAVTPIREAAASSYRTIVLLIVGAVACVLLIACVNVSGLLLARATARRSEVAVRASLGASRWRIVRQLLTESLVLACVGTAGGLLLAWWLLPGVVDLLPLRLPGAPVALDARVVAALCLLLAPIVLIVGLAPAIRLSAAGTDAPGAQGASQVGSRLSRRAGQGLVALEVALAVVLLISAGLLIRSYTRLTSVDLGFQADNLLTMEVLPLIENADGQRVFYQALLQQIRGVPGIQAASLVDSLPFGDLIVGTTIEGRDGTVSTAIAHMMPGYFDTLEPRLLAGRFPVQTDHDGEERIAVINESAALAIFGQTDGVGRQFEIGRNGAQTTVLGVIADIRHRGPQDTPRPQVFTPYEHGGVVVLPGLRFGMWVVARVDSSSIALRQRLRQVTAAIGPRVFIGETATMAELLSDRVAPQRRRATILGILGGIGLTLALIGLFGMTAFTVARRTGEIGVRMAFGARAGTVVWEVFRHSAVAVLVGLVAGLAGASAANRLLERYLFETQTMDATTIAAVVSLLGATAAIAALVPAARAARVNPVDLLRHD